VGWSNLPLDSVVGEPPELRLAPASRWNPGAAPARCSRVGSVTPDGYLLHLWSATADLVRAIGGLSDADVRAATGLRTGRPRSSAITSTAR
jgi:hypothetical protein